MRDTEKMYKDNYQAAMNRIKQLEDALKDKKEKVKEPTGKTMKKVREFFEEYWVGLFWFCSLFALLGGLICGIYDERKNQQKHKEQLSIATKACKRYVKNKDTEITKVFFTDITKDRFIRCKLFEPDEDGIYSVREITVKVKE